MKRRAFSITGLVAALTLLATGMATFIYAQVPSSTSHSGAVVENQITSAIIPVRNADVNEVAKVLETFRGQLGGVVKANAALRVISVSGSKALVKACEAAAQKLDVPPKPRQDLLLTFYVLRASREEMPKGKVPTDLEPVVSQVRKLGAFKSFYLLDSQAVRVRPGNGAEVGGAMVGESSAEGDVPYRIAFESADRTAPKQNVHIRLKGLELKAQIHWWNKKTLRTAPLILKTDVDFTEGQKAVIGTTGIPGSRDALLLVVTARDAS